MIIPLESKKVGCDIKMHIHSPKDDIGVSKYISENKVWEPFETAIFCDILQNKSFFIDIGANLGYYSLIAAKHFNSEGIVLSLEPELNNFSLLQENILLNDLSNIKAINVACSDKTGQAAIKKSVNNYGDHRVISEQEVQANDYIETTTVDELIIKEGKIPDLLKIDTQGSELSIIHGMSHLLENLTMDTVIILEYWPHGICDRDQSPEELLDYLEQFDLDILVMYEETSTISQCDLEDLSRWTKTVLTPESEQYVNLIFGKDSNRDIIKLKEKHIGHESPFQFNKLHSSINNERLNCELNPIGWSFPEEHGVWNNGQYAEMKIRSIYFNKENRDYYLSLNVLPFLVEDRVTFQRVKITINGEVLGEYKLENIEMTELKISLPEKVLSNNEGFLSISFQFLDCHSPKYYGLSSDQRQLAMLLKGYGIYFN
jgi:FkbM family methyltransferase